MIKCRNCNKDFKRIRNTLGIYCSIKCQKDFEFQLKVENWKNNLELGYTGKTIQLKKFIKRYLYQKHGTKCSECGWDKKHPSDNKPLTEIDHIDGNAKNCVESNLRILCPNCHSLTLTYKARNKVSERNRKS